MSEKWKARITQMTIVPTSDPRMIHEYATKVDVDDEGAGEFLLLSQIENQRGLRIQPDEWPVLRSAIDEMMQGLVGDE